MKTAQLPSGQLLNFPDHMSDEEIDQQVRQHIGALDDEQRAAQEAEEKENQRKAGDLHYSGMKEQGEASRALKAQQHGESMQLAAHGIQLQTQMGMARNAHLENMTGQLGQLVAGLSHNLAGVNAIAPMLHALTQAVVQLSNDVRASTDQIVAALASPKSLTFDGRGRPIGIRPNIKAPSDNAPPSQPDIDDQPAGNA